MRRKCLRLDRDGIGIEEDWLGQIEPAHFSHIKFRCTFSFNIERYADVLVEPLVGRAKPSHASKAYYHVPRSWRRDGS